MHTDKYKSYKNIWTSNINTVIKAIQFHKQVLITYVELHSYVSPSLNYDGLLHMGIIEKVELFLL